MAARRPRVLTLSPKESVILQLLVRDDEAYGLELVAASRGRLKRGTVYVTLGRMEEKGYITSRLEEAPPDAGGLPRRVYKATALGRQILEAWSQPAKFLIPAVTR
jgi:DNA-binding PadR family transcriptional regulator